MTAMRDSGLKVLVGPSFLDLGSIDKIDWRGAVVRYFKKDRGSIAPDAWKRDAVEYFGARARARPTPESDLIYYDVASIAAGPPSSAPLPQQCLPHRSR